MREHIKLFEEVLDKTTCDSNDLNKKAWDFCMSHDVLSPILNSDSSIDAEEVSISNLNLSEIPITFNKINTNFECRSNNLVSLKNGPKYVGGHFSCAQNHLLTSLEFCPKFVGLDLYVYGCNIKPWEYRYLLFSEIQGEIITGTSGLNAFFEKYQNKKALIPEALKVLKETQYYFDRNQKEGWNNA